MSHTLTLSGDFEHPHLDSLCHELQDLPEWTPGEPARIDLCELGSMAPTTLAVLLTSIDGLHRRRICRLEDLDPPRAGRNGVGCLHPEVLNGLFGDGDGHWQEIDGDSPAILGCEAFSDVDKVTAGLFCQLERHTDWSQSSLSSLVNMIFELSENVLEHSQARGGVAVLRMRPAEQRISLAIADGGVGIRRSLARNPEFSDLADDLTAITKATGVETTGEPRTGAGMGLFLARCLARSNGGAFMVRSGRAWCEEGEVRRSASGVPNLHGTLISLEARTDVPFEHDKAVASRLGMPASANPRRRSGY